VPAREEIRTAGRIPVVYDESTLRRMAAEAMRAGRIPARRALRTWAGTGGGYACAVCHAHVSHEEVEFELDFGELPDAPGTCRMHAHCFAAWEFARENFAAPRTRGR
jgi:hypothetical protein